MTANTCTVPMAALAAVAPFMGKNDVRYHLNSVLLQRAAGAKQDAATAGTRLVATDGHTLIAVRDTDPDTEAWDGPDTIIPRELIDWALKQKKVASVEIRREGDAVTITAGTMSVSGTAIDARYPEWQAVFPLALKQGESRYSASGIDAAYIERIGKAAIAARKADGRRGTKRPAVTIEPAGECAARFAFEMPEGLVARGVIMPMRRSAVPLDVEDVL